MRARVLIAAFSVAVACSGAPGDDASLSDAGTDGGREAGRDAGRDGGHDASEDDAWRSVHDARVPSLPPDDPGWTSIPGFPSDCLQYALQPQAVLAFHWERCPGSLSVCEWTVVDHAAAPLLRVAPNHGGTDARGAMVWILEDPDRVEIIYYVIVHDDEAVFAWRSDLCSPDTTVNRTTVGVDAAYWFSGVGHDDFIGLASWSDLTPLVDGLWQVPSGVITNADLVQSPSASETTFAIDTTTAVLVAEPPRWAMFPEIGAEPVVVGHYVLGLRASAESTAGFDVVSLDEGRQPLYPSTRPGMHVYGLEADATDIVWREGPDDPTHTSFPLNELWTAPFETSMARFAPRRVRDDLGSCASTTCAAIGDGTYAYVNSSTSGQFVAAISLADGTQRRFAVPPASADGTRWGLLDNPIWVSQSEVVTFGWHSAGSGSPVRAAIRIDLRSLPIEPAP